MLEYLGKPVKMDSRIITIENDGISEDLGMLCLFRIRV